MSSIRLPDFELDHQAAIFAANPVFRRLGVSFEFFVAHGPLACLRDFSRYPDSLPLLPAQERVRIKLAGMWAHPRRSRAGGPFAGLEERLAATGHQVQGGGRWIEKLTRRAWPRKRPGRT